MLSLLQFLQVVVIAVLFQVVVAEVPIWEASVKSVAKDVLPCLGEAYADFRSCASQRLETLVFGDLLHRRA